MSIPRVLVLYEYSHTALPHGSAYIRLLQPLSHPVIQQRFQHTPSPVYRGQKADIVIVDRYWHADTTRETVAELVKNIRTSGARLVYQIDDDLLNRPDSTDEMEVGRQCIQLFLQEADGVIVSTPNLRQRFASINPRIYVVRNALDERLLTTFGGGSIPRIAASESVVLGYMGTFTHEDDLRM
nr:hypothetical protein [Caldilineaceae bacterium]